MLSVFFQTIHTYTYLKTGQFAGYTDPDPAPGNNDAPTIWGRIPAVRSRPAFGRFLKLFRIE